VDVVASVDVIVVKGNDALAEEGGVVVGMVVSSKVVFTVKLVGTGVLVDVGGLVNAGKLDPGVLGDGVLEICKVEVGEV
jgi:hypothetical protein